MVQLNLNLNQVWFRSKEDLIGLFWDCFKEKIVLFCWVLLEVKGAQNEAILHVISELLRLELEMKIRKKISTKYFG